MRRSTEVSHSPQLVSLGSRIRLARKRRELTAERVAHLAGLSVPTLRALERGGAGVGIGAYLSVLKVFGLEKDLDSVGGVDDVGRQLQDLRLQMGKKR
jgi:transcriptional regulator with XRE-family HTH domain